jgi:NitT/TauT family transport system substrate-binding protein
MRSVGGSGQSPRPSRRRIASNRAVAALREAAGVADTTAGIWFARPAPALAALFLAVFVSAAARAQDRVRFGLDWKAEAEYGGFYQALATGLYAKRGLDVTIEEGGPQVNHMMLLMAGRLDFNLAGGRAIEFAERDLPFLAIAAIFQKSLSVLIAHPGQRNDSFAALRGKPIMIGADARVGWWRFVAAKYGYDDSQIRPYTFNLAPFFANDKAIQEGYASSEPYLIGRKTGIEPVVLPLSAAGYQGYANIIETSDKLIRERPDMVQRFVDASIEGWYSYLYGDPAPANRLIMRTNPEMPADLLAFGRKTLIDRGIVDSGDAKTLGIGAMTDAQWQGFYRSMTAVGVYPPGIDLKKAYTTRFVDKGVGMESAR